MLLHEIDDGCVSKTTVEVLVHIQLNMLRQSVSVASVRLDEIETGHISLSF